MLSCCLHLNVISNHIFHIIYSVIYILPLPGKSVLAMGATLTGSTEPTVAFRVHCNSISSFCWIKFVGNSSNQDEATSLQEKVGDRIFD